MNVKNKLYIFQRLRNDQHAVADLQLLKAKYPTCKHIDRFARNPKRYAFDILYALLDVADEDEIVQNRQSEEKPEVDVLKIDGSSETLIGISETNPELDDKKILEDGSSKTLTEEDPEPIDTIGDTTGTAEDMTEEATDTTEDTAVEEVEQVESQEEDAVSPEEDSSKKK